MSAGISGIAGSGNSGLSCVDAPAFMNCPVRGETGCGMKIAAGRRAARKQAPEKGKMYIALIL